MRTYNGGLRKDKAGLPALPRLIFLDTNVVQNIQTFFDLVHGYDLSPKLQAKISASGDRFTTDIYALARFIALGQGYCCQFAVSSGTLAELADTPQIDKRSALADWGNQLANNFATYREGSSHAVEGSSYGEISHFTFLQRCALSNMLRELPQESDRQLIIDAIEYGCDIFLTMDYRTVWRYRENVSRLGVDVMRPVELLEYIGPWVGLLR